MINSIQAEEFSIAKSISIFGLVALIVLAVSTPRAVSRNPAHNAAPILPSPTSVACVVPAVCAVDGPGRTNAGGSASFQSISGVLTLQLIGNTTPYAPGPVSGWEVFNSHPGINPGNTSPTSSSFAPPGIYAFNVSGLPAGNNFLEVVSVDKFDNQNYSGQGPLTNGRVTALAPTVRNQATPTAVYFWISSATAPLGTISLTNFTVNGSPLALDSSHIDNSPPTAGTFRGAGISQGPSSCDY